MSGHIHKLYKQKTSTGKNIYRCGFSGCPSFYYEAIVVGQASICWRCGDKFVISRGDLRIKYFHCQDCTKTKVKSDNLDAADKLIDEMMEGGKIN